MSLCILIFYTVWDSFSLPESEGGCYYKALNSLILMELTLSDFGYVRMKIVNDAKHLFFDKMGHNHSIDRAHTRTHSIVNYFRSIWA